MVTADKIQTKQLISVTACIAFAEAITMHGRDPDAVLFERKRCCCKDQHHPAAMKCILDVPVIRSVGPLSMLVYISSVEYS